MAEDAGARGEYVVADRWSLGFDHDRMVFRQERVPVVAPPPEHRRRMWVNLMVFGVLLGLFEVALRTADSPDLPLIEVGVVLVVMGVVGGARWHRARRRWERETAGVGAGAYAIRLSWEAGVVELIGPFRSGISARLAEATEPVVACVSLDAVELVRRDEGPWPRDDIEAKHKDVWSAWLVIREAPLPDLEGEFFVFEGLERDERWYAVAGDAKAERRLTRVRELLAGEFVED